MTPQSGASTVQPQDAPQERFRSTENHVLALDGLRGAAILLVLFFHFPAPFAWLLPLSKSGWVGVDLFFVLSGYLITGILWSSKTSAHYYRNFYARRCLRIFPVYYGFMILTLLVLPRFVNPYWLGVETVDQGLKPFFLYYSNYADVFIAQAPATLGPFWSLAVEEHFYFFWPMFIKITPRNRLIPWCAVIATLALISRLAIVGFKGSWLAAYFLTTSRVDSLVVGAMTAIIVKQYADGARRWMKPIGCALLIVICTMAVWRHGLAFNSVGMRTFGYSLLALMFASVVWLAGNTRGPVSRFLSNRFLVTFGKYSYCLYVVHMLVLAVCKRWLRPVLFPALGATVNAPLFIFAVSLGASFAIAWLSWRFYERPFLSLKARFTG